MFKKCPKCDAKNDVESPFCTNCGENLEGVNSDSFISNDKIDKSEQKPSFDYNEPVPFKDTFHVEPTGYQPYGHVPHPIIEKQSKKKKKLIVIVAIVIVVILVLTAFYVIVLSEQKKETEFEKLINGLKEEANDYSLGTAKTKIDGGPTLNLQSLASGNFRTVSEMGRIAKYNLYYNGELIGTLNEGTVGTISYEGKDYLLILGNSYVDINYYGTTIAYSMDYKYYIEEDSNIPVLMTINYDYDEPAAQKMQMEITWNQDTNEIITTQSQGGQSITTTSNLPDEYWGMISSIDDLYVGYNKNIDYTISALGESLNVDLTFSVTDQEDIVVPAGTFENCYVLEFNQDLQSAYVNIKVWISENGIVPKAEVDMSMSSYLSMDITQKLEGYYTT